MTSPITPEDANSWYKPLRILSQVEIIVKNFDRQEVVQLKVECLN